MSQLREKLVTDRRTDSTEFIGPTAGVQKTFKFISDMEHLVRQYNDFFLVVFTKKIVRTHANIKTIALLTLLLTFRCVL